MSNFAVDKQGTRMIPLLPTNTHLDFARELSEQRHRTNPELPDDIDYVASRHYELAPDPLYLAMSRLWTRMSNLLSNGFRRPV